MVGDIMVVDIVKQLQCLNIEANASSKQLDDVIAELLSTPSPSGKRLERLEKLETRRSLIRGRSTTGTPSWRHNCLERARTPLPCLWPCTGTAEAHRCTLFVMQLAAAVLAPDNMECGQQANACQL